MLIPSFRSEQLALARNVMHCIALGTYATGPQLPHGATVRLLVPYYDAQIDSVRMFDVISQGWLRDENRPCDALRELAAPNSELDMVAVDRVPSTQFWVDTLIWLYQTRRAIVLGANEFVAQREQLIAGLACADQQRQIREGFVLAEELPDETSDRQRANERQPMRG